MYTYIYIYTYNFVVYLFIYLLICVCLYRSIYVHIIVIMITTIMIIREDTRGLEYGVQAPVFYGSLREHVRKRFSANTYRKVV